MLEGINIEQKAEALLANGRLVETAGFSVADGVFNAENADAVVEGNMEIGAVARGLRSVVVRGDVVGSVKQPCRLTFGGDVVVLGRVVHARLSGDHIWVGGEVSHCQVACRNQFHAGGQLAASEVVVGSVGMAQKQMNLLTEHMQKTREKLQLINQQLVSEERRVEKLIQSTQFHVAFGAGQIIVRTRNRVRVNLTRFYEALKGRSADSVDKALIEFFNKAVVGLLTKKNRYLIQDNVNRRKVFMGLIRNLHALFVHTRKRDQARQSLESYDHRLAQVVADLSRQDAYVVLHGGICPPLTFLFVVPYLSEESGEQTVVAQEAKLHIEEANDAVHIKSINTKGEEVLDMPLSDNLQGARLRVVDGQIQWHHNGSGEPV